MRIENSFRVDLPLERAWPVLLDVPSLVPCMPGAELLKIDDERTYLGQVKAKLGPVAVAFRGRARLVEVDNAQHLVRASAFGTEQKGRGSAQAEITFRLTPDGSGTRVDVLTDIALAGAVAQYGRAQGVIADVAQVMINSFSRNLGGQIQSMRDAPAAAAASAPAASGKAPAVSVFTILWALLRHWFARFTERRSQ